MREISFIWYHELPIFGVLLPHITLATRFHCRLCHLQCNFSHILCLNLMYSHLILLPTEPSLLFTCPLASYATYIAPITAPQPSTQTRSNHRKKKMYMSDQPHAHFPPMRYYHSWSSSQLYKALFYAVIWNIVAFNRFLLVGIFFLQVTSLVRYHQRNKTF